jgi:hypothetical protein
MDMQTLISPTNTAPSASQPAGHSRMPHALFVIGIFCLFAFVSQRDMNRLAALRARGIEGRAVITALHKNTSGGRRAFSVSYRFEAAVRFCEGVRGVPERYYSRAKVGDAMLVTYLPDDPENHYVGRVDDALLAGRRENQAIGLGIVGAVCGGMLLALFHDAQKKRSPAS